MEQIIAWLIAIEKGAQRFYAACARALAAEHPEAAHMLARLSSDEAQHALYLEQALDCCIRSENCPDAIRLDRATAMHAETAFQNFEAILKNGQPTLAQIIENVIQIERSEWNELFLYVVSSLRSQCPELAHVPPQMQHHLRYIETNLAAIAPGRDWGNRIRDLTPVWQENILVVDDEAPIATLLKTFLSRDGIVHAVADGSQALNKIQQQYFAVIISDVDMPVMDGWMFYRRARRQFDGIGQRCVFITGNPASPAARKLKAEGLDVLAKPFSLTDIRQKVYDLLECNARSDCADLGHA